MACGCNGASAKIKETKLFEVTLRDGTKKTVTSEYEARVAITRAGGGSFTAKG